MSNILISSTRESVIRKAHLIYILMQLGCGKSNPVLHMTQRAKECFASFFGGVLSNTAWTHQTQSMQMWIWENGLDVIC